MGDVVQSPNDAYRVVRRRGAGGFSEVWVAARVSDGRHVILKELRLEKLKDWKSLELFEREARVLQGLKHPGIPEYLEFFARTTAGPVEPSALSEDPGARLCLVQELVPGRDFSEILGAGAPLEPVFVENIFRQALQVLVYLHGLNPPVIHRDLHPRNLVVSDDGQLHVIDFGAIQDRLLMGDEFGSTSVGTFGYIPMEQAMGQARPASDLFALGMSMVTLITGRSPSEMPFEESTGAVDLAALEIPQRWRPVLEGMVQPIVGKRLASASRALELLNNPSQHRVASAPSAGVQRPTIPVSPWAKWVFRLAFFGALGAAGFIYLLNFNNFSETELVNMAPFWVVPAVFGFSGFLYSGGPHPVVRALVTALVSIAVLVFFFSAIFPGL